MAPISQKLFLQKMLERRLVKTGGEETPSVKALRRQIASFDTPLENETVWVGQMREGQASKKA